MVTKSLTNIPQGRIDKTIIFIFPILITILNSNWIFSPTSNYLPDPGFYVGYFRYFFDYAPEYPSNIHYFVERVTWNIPGYLIYHILPSLIANYVLHLLVCYTALFSLYGILNMFFGNRTALLSTLLLCVYPWFLRAILRAFPKRFKITSESQMNPSWMNGFLYRIFLSELPILRFMGFPFRVSILCVCKKPKADLGL